MTLLILVWLKMTPPFLTTWLQVILVVKKNKEFFIICYNKLNILGSCWRLSVWRVVGDTWTPALSYGPAAAAHSTSGSHHLLQLISLTVSLFFF